MHETFFFVVVAHQARWVWKIIKQIDSSKSVVINLPLFNTFVSFFPLECGLTLLQSCALGSVLRRRVKAHLPFQFNQFCCIIKTSCNRCCCYYCCFYGSQLNHQGLAIIVALLPYSKLNFKPKQTVEKFQHLKKLIENQSKRSAYLS